MPEGPLNKLFESLKDRLARWLPEEETAGATVDPEAVARELIRVAHRNRVHVRSEGAYVPCRYLVALPAADLQRLDEIGARGLVERSLVTALQEYVAERRLRLNGRLEVRLSASDAVEPGSVGIDFSFSPPGAGPPPGAGERTVVVRLGAQEVDAFLEALDGPQQGARFELVALPATLGRTRQEAQLTVGLQDLPEHSRVSRHHARIERQGERWHLVDTNSSNGTWLNGQRLEAGAPYTLVDGDTINLARQVSLRFRVRDEGQTMVRKAR